LAASDYVQRQGKPVPQIYSVTFDGPVTNPVIHLHSFASTLTFSNGATPIKVSGESTLTVSGNQVIGATDDSPSGHDANGTIMFSGVYTGFVFAAQYTLASAEAPKLTVTSPKGNSIHTQPGPAFTIEGTASDTGGIAAVEFNHNSSGYVPADIAGGTRVTNWNDSITMTPEPTRCCCGPAISWEIIH
jgi:hypothetical protein